MLLGLCYDQDNFCQDNVDQGDQSGHHNSEDVTEDHLLG